MKLRGSPSIGVRWAIRNAALFALVLFGIALFAHLEVRRRVTEDAKLLLELEVRELVEELGTGALSAAQIAEEVDPEIAAAPDPDLELGVQVFDGRGERVYARGKLASLGVGLPPELEAAGSESVFSVIEIEGDSPYWVVSARGAEGTVQIGVSSREFVASAGQLGRVLVTAAPLLALIAGVAGWLIAKQSLDPIREMVRTARGIRFSRLTSEIPTSGNGDELDLLAQTLNEAFARVREGADKLRRFTADAAHELRTPLSRLRTRLEATLADPEADRGRLREVVRDTVTELDALSDTLAATLLLAESEAGLRPGQGEPLVLDRLLAELLEFYGPMASEQGLTLELEAAERIRLVGMPAWLRQVFSNLLRNALAHAKRTVRVRVRGAGGRAVVTIEDDGPGIPPDELPRVFDRFHRVAGDGSGPGSGLGLAIALQMVKAHGGTIEAENGAPHGTIFRVTLPRSEKDAARRGRLSAAGA